MRQSSIAHTTVPPIRIQFYRPLETILPPVYTSVTSSYVIGKRHRHSLAWQAPKTSFFPYRCCIFHVRVRCFRVTIVASRAFFCISQARSADALSASCSCEFSTKCGLECFFETPSTGKVCHPVCQKCIRVSVFYSHMSKMAIFDM